MSIGLYMVSTSNYENLSVPAVSSTLTDRTSAAPFVTPIARAHPPGSILADRFAAFHTSPIAHKILSTDIYPRGRSRPLHAAFPVLRAVRSTSCWSHGRRRRYAVRLPTATMSPLQFQVEQGTIHPSPSTASASNFTVSTDADSPVTIHLGEEDLVSGFILNKMTGDPSSSPTITARKASEKEAVQGRGGYNRTASRHNRQSGLGMGRLDC